MSDSVEDIYADMNEFNDHSISQDLVELKLALASNNDTDVEYDSESDASEAVSLVRPDLITQPSADDTEQEAFHTSVHVQNQENVEREDRSYQQAHELPLDDDDENGDDIGLDVTADQLPTNPKTCLAWNRAYQEIIQDYLQRVEAALQANRKKQEDIQRVFKAPPAEGKLSVEKDEQQSLSIYTIPYFKDVNGMYPPPNADTLTKRSQNEYSFMDLSRRTVLRIKWKASDVQLLHDAVYEDLVAQRMRPFLNRKALLVDKMNDCLDSEEKERLTVEVQKLNLEIEKVRSMSRTEMYDSHKNDALYDSLDWMKISCTAFDGKRSALDCKQYWVTQAHPSISTTKWTSDEEAMLIELAQNDELTWPEIAEKFPNRTTVQCLRHYQTKLHPSLSHGKWTAQEEEQLLSVIETLKRGDYIPWDDVGDSIQGRTQEQCYNKWVSMNQQKVSGRWSMDEDMQLVAATNYFIPPRWSKISEYVENRSSQQCRERWCNEYDPTLKFDNWTYEEDKLIWLYYLENGPKVSYAKVALLLTGRTDAQVKLRLMRLKSWHKTQGCLYDLPEPIADLFQRRREGIFKREDKMKAFTMMKNLYGMRKDTQVERHKSALEGGIAKTSEQLKETCEKDEKNERVDVASRQIMHVLKQTKKEYVKQYKKTAGIWDKQRAIDISKGIIVPTPPQQIVQRQPEMFALNSERLSVRKVVQQHLLQVEKEWHQYGSLDTAPAMDKMMTAMKNVKGFGEDPNSLQLRILTMKKFLEELKTQRKKRRYIYYKTRPAPLGYPLKDLKRMRYQTLKDNMAYLMRSRSKSMKTSRTVKFSSNMYLVDERPGGGKSYEFSHATYQKVLMLLLKALDIDTEGAKKMTHLLINQDKTRKTRRMHVKSEATENEKSADGCTDRCAPGHSSQQTNIPVEDNTALSSSDRQTQDATDSHATSRLDNSASCTNIMSDQTSTPAHHESTANAVLSRFNDEHASEPPTKRRKQFDASELARMKITFGNENSSYQHFVPFDKEIKTIESTDEPGCVKRESFMYNKMPNAKVHKTINLRTGALRRQPYPNEVFNTKIVDVGEKEDKVTHIVDIVSGEFDRTYIKKHFIDYLHNMKSKNVSADIKQFNALPMHRLPTSSSKPESTDTASVPITLDNTQTNIDIQVGAFKGEEAVKRYNFPALPPNWTTLEGFKSFLLRRPQLLKNAEIHTPTGVQSAHLERVCQQHDFMMLKARCRALFLWPAILSTTPHVVPEDRTADDQNETPCSTPCNAPVQRRVKKRYTCRKKRKRLTQEQKEALIKKTKYASSFRGKKKPDDQAPKKPEKLATRPTSERLRNKRMLKQQLSLHQQCDD